MNNALKFEEVFGMNLIDLYSMKEYRYKAYLEWLNKEYIESKLEKEKPQIEEKPDEDCNKLGFEDLYNYVGTPVYVIHPGRTFTNIRSEVITVSASSESRSWEIVAGVKKTEAHEYVLFRGRNDWLEIDKLLIYESKDAANESA